MAHETVLEHEAGLARGTRGASITRGANSAISTDQRVAIETRVKHGSRAVQPAEVARCRRHSVDGIAAGGTVRTYGTGCAKQTQICVDVKLE